MSEDELLVTKELIVGIIDEVQNFQRHRRILLKILASRFNRHVPGQVLPLMDWLTAA